MLLNSKKNHIKEMINLRHKKPVAMVLLVLLLLAQCLPAFAALEFTRVFPSYNKGTATVTGTVTDTVTGTVYSSNVEFSIMDKDILVGSGTGSANFTPTPETVSYYVYASVNGVPASQPKLINPGTSTRVDTLKLNSSIYGKVYYNEIRVSMKYGTKPTQYNVDVKNYANSIYIKIGNQTVDNTFPYSFTDSDNDGHWDTVGLSVYAPNNSSRAHTLDVYENVPGTATAPVTSIVNNATLSASPATIAGVALDPDSGNVGISSVDAVITDNSGRYLDVANKQFTVGSAVYNSCGLSGGMAKDFIAKWSLRLDGFILPDGTYTIKTYANDDAYGPASTTTFTVGSNPGSGGGSSGGGDSDGGSSGSPTDNTSGSASGNTSVPTPQSSDEHTFKLPVPSITKASSSKKIELESGIGSLSIPENMVKAIEASGANFAEIKLAVMNLSAFNKDIQDVLGGRPAVEISITLDGKPFTWKNPSAPITISIPYTLKENESGKQEKIIAGELVADNKLVSISSSRYNAKTGMLTFAVSNLGKFGIFVNEKTFSDLADFPWARKEIEVMAAKGIINGTGTATFDPKSSITRAEFLHLLVNALGLYAENGTDFTDVKPTDYFYQTVGIARSLELAKGTGDNKFNPNELISRQDMMVLTARAMRTSGKLSMIPKVQELLAYADYKEIEAYALEDVASLVKEGIVKGFGNVINPAANTSRAEAAVLIYRIYNQ